MLLIIEVSTIAMDENSNILNQRVATVAMPTKFSIKAHGPNKVLCFSRYPWFFLHKLAPSEQFYPPANYVPLCL